MRRLLGVLSDRLYLSAVGVLLVLVVTVTYLFAEVLDAPLTASPVDLTVVVGSTGGLFEGSAVTYRGAKVGKVREITMTREGAHVQVRLRAGTEIPRDARAQVRSLSPVGEQYLDFQPRTDQGPFLADGDTLEAGYTDLPVTLSSTVVALNDVLSQVDDRKLRSLLGELSTGLSGTGDDLGRILDQGDLLLAELDAAWPQTRSLIRTGDRALDVVPGSAADLERLGTSARRLAAFLREEDPLLRRTLRRGPGQLAELEALVEDARRVLPGFLEVGVSLTDVFALREPHFRELLGSYAPGLGTLGRVVRDGELRIELIFDKDQRCDYGAPRRSPRDPERRPLRTDLACSPSLATLQRGAAHAPGPLPGAPR